MTTYRMKIAYAGTDFVGWQVQNTGPTIQGTIEKAIKLITREDVRLIGSGRTDTGVHAQGQVAVCMLKDKKDPHSLQRSLNGVLPPSIRIMELESAPQEFHAQLSAIGKEYHYFLCLHDVILPFHRHYMWHCRHKVDLDILSEAATYFLGSHNFKAFANTRGHGMRPKSYVRTIQRLDVVPTDLGVRLEFEGNGFLYKMVRNITGMLISVASGRHNLQNIREVLESQDRRKAPQSAPARGLFLMNVIYPANLLANTFEE